MPDPPNLTPPPEEPLPPQRKALIRQRLSAMAMGEPERGTHRWLVPGLAAAAVLTVVSGAFAMSLTNDGSGGGDKSLQPAGQGTTTATDDNSKEATKRTGPPTKAPLTDCKALPGMKMSARECRVMGAANEPVSCDKEVANVLDEGLPDARVTDERNYGPGTTYLYENASAWLICDNLAASDGGSPTLFSVHDKSQAYQPGTETLAISENHNMNPDGGWISQFVGGGRDFDGVEAISYAFPDGHEEDAVVGPGGLWSMAYVPTEGVLVEPNTNFSQLDPIEVTVNYTGGDVQTFTLQWGLHTCAHINHGC